MTDLHQEASAAIEMLNEVKVDQKEVRIEAQRKEDNSKIKSKIKSLPRLTSGKAGKSASVEIQSAEALSCKVPQ